MTDPTTKAAECIHAAICEESLTDCLDPEWAGRCLRAARSLATAGLIPDTQEWGVRYRRSAAPHEFPMPSEQLARELAADTDAALVTRWVTETDWQEVTE